MLTPNFHQFCRLVEGEVQRGRSGRTFDGCCWIWCISGIRGSGEHGPSTRSSWADATLCGAEATRRVNRRHAGHGKHSRAWREPDTRQACTTNPVSLRLYSSNLRTKAQQQTHSQTCCCLPRCGFALDVDVPRAIDLSFRVFSMHISREFTGFGDRRRLAGTKYAISYSLQQHLHSCVYPITVQRALRQKADSRTFSLCDMAPPQLTK